MAKVAGMAVGATAAVVAVVGEVVVVEMVAEARVAGVRVADSAQAMTVAVGWGGDGGGREG